MKYWLVIHDMESYKQHSNWIGCAVKDTRSGSMPKSVDFMEMKKGDKIVYYAKGDMVIIGTFEITSDGFVVEDDKYWGRDFCYKIAPINVPDTALDFKALIDDPEINFHLFPDKKKWGSYLQGKSARPLDEHDFKLISSFLEKPPEPAAREPATTISESIGAPVETRIALLYNPVNELGVVCLFSKFHRELGFPYIKMIRSSFPDAIVLDKMGKERKIEFEYRSTTFRTHGHPSDKCDFIVCWEHDWLNAPVKVIELKSELPKLLHR